MTYGSVHLAALIISIYAIGTGLAFSIAATTSGITSIVFVLCALLLASFGIGVWIWEFRR